MQSDHTHQQLHHQTVTTGEEILKLWTLLGSPTFTISTGSASTNTSATLSCTGHCSACHAARTTCSTAQVSKTKPKGPALSS